MGVVEAHGGRIWPESDGDGRGSQFSFAMPLAHEDESEPPQRSYDVGTVGRLGQGTRILTIDDEPLVLRLVRKTLMEAGYAPVGTGDPRKVVQLLETERPHLVLLDLMMPGINGLDLMRRIRRSVGGSSHFSVRARQRRGHRQGSRTGCRRLFPSFSPNPVWVGSVCLGPRARYRLRVAYGQIGPHIVSRAVCLRVLAALRGR